MDEYSEFNDNFNDNFDDISPPKFHCPNEKYYSPIIGGIINSFEINAYNKDHPLNTEYSWDFDYNDPDNSKMKKMFMKGEDTNLISFRVELSGKINIELHISSTIGATIYSRQCSIQIIFHESPYFGIDLGTTYSCIAYQKKVINDKTNKRDTTVVISDKHRNEYCIPTAIYFDKYSEEVIIGHNALKKQISDPLNVIYDIKRIIGRRNSDKEVINFKQNHMFRLTNDEYPRIIIPNRMNTSYNGIITCEQALSVILSHLVLIASKDFDVPFIKNVVVSIPALFHNNQRKGIRSAAALAGLNVIKLVVEPTVAALAHSYTNNLPENNLKVFLAFDFGGGTLDCSLLRCSGNECQVLNVNGNSSLGGIDFDDVILNIMINKYNKIHEWNIDKHNNKYKKLITKLKKVSEKVKKTLTQNNWDKVNIHNNLLNEKKEIIIYKHEFENNPKTIELINNAVKIANDSINYGDLKSEYINMILMIGGTSKIPIIQNKLKSAFKHKNLTLIIPKQDPQLMVVKGSAIIGASLAYDIYNNIKDDTKHDQIIVEDVIPLSLGFSVCKKNKLSYKIECGLFDPIILKNSQYPTKKYVKYCQKDPNSNIAKLDLYEGVNKYVKDNEFLSHLSIQNIPKRDKKKCDNINVKFEIDQNGIAKIYAYINIDSINNITKMYNTSLPIASNDGTLSQSQIKNISKQMINWYKHNEIKNILKNI